METTNSHPIFNLKKAYSFHSDVETKQLRSFGIIFFVFFALVVGLGPLVLRGATPRVWALGIGGGFLFVGLLMPRRLRALYQGWMVIGGVLGFINTRVILGLVFFLILTPTGVIRRLMGKDSLGLRFDSKVESYKVLMNNNNIKLDMRRQF